MLPEGGYLFHTVRCVHCLPSNRAPLSMCSFPPMKNRQKLCLMLPAGGRVFPVFVAYRHGFLQEVTLKAKIGEVFSAYGANLGKKNKTFFQLVTELPTCSLPTKQYNNNIIFLLLSRQETQPRYV